MYIGYNLMVVNQPKPRPCHIEAMVLHFIIITYVCPNKNKTDARFWVLQSSFPVWKRIFKCWFLHIFWFRLVAFWFLPRFYCKSSDKAGTVFVAPCWMILPHSTHDHISRQRYSVEIESILLMVVSYDSGMISGSWEVCPCYLKMPWIKVSRKWYEQYPKPH